MNRNLLLISVGVVLLGLFLTGLYYLQTGRVAPDKLPNHYTIEVYNCSPIASSSDIDIELRALLKSSLVNSGSDFVMPIVKKGKGPINFGVPISLKNAWAINPALFTFNERKVQEDDFFGGEYKASEGYNNLKKSLANGDPSFSTLVPGSSVYEFTIYNSLGTTSDAEKKIWKNFQGLRAHIDKSFASNVFKAGDVIKVYYRCGNPPCIDKDLDGICDNVDRCPGNRGDERHNGCPCRGDQDRDGICDDEDRCINRAGPRPTGCPCPDDDRDNVCNEDDKCPGVKGNARDGCLQIAIGLKRDAGTNHFSWNPLLTRNARKLFFQYTVNGITYDPIDVTGRNDYCIASSSRITGYSNNLIKLIIEMKDSKVKIDGRNTLTTDNLNCTCH